MLPFDQRCYLPVKERIQRIRKHLIEKLLLGVYIGNGKTTPFVENVSGFDLSILKSLIGPGHSSFINIFCHFWWHWGLVWGNNYQVFHRLFPPFFVMNLFITTISFTAHLLGPSQIFNYQFT